MNHRALAVVLAVVVFLALMMSAGVKLVGADAVGVVLGVLLLMGWRPFWDWYHRAKALGLAAQQRRPGVMHPPARPLRPTVACPACGFANMDSPRRCQACGNDLP